MAALPSRPSRDGPRARGRLRAPARRLRRLLGLRDGGGVRDAGLRPTSPRRPPRGHPRRTEGDPLMPEFLEAKLKRQYGADSDVPYRVMNAKGYMKGSKTTDKGRRAEAQHRKRALLELTEDK